MRWEDVKLFMHNGLHAFVSYRAHLDGVKFFPDTPAHIREAAVRAIQREIAPAVARNHPNTDEREIVRYGLGLLDRFFNPHFNDSIERGVRGIEEKLAPGERLTGACDFIRRAGIEPKEYAETVRIAREISRRPAGPQPKK